LRVAWERLLIALGISRSSAFCDMDLFTEGQTRSYWKQTRIYISAMHVLPLPKTPCNFYNETQPFQPGPPPEESGSTCDHHSLPVFFLPFLPLLLVNPERWEPPNMSNCVSLTDARYGVASGLEGEGREEEGTCSVSLAKLEAGEVQLTRHWSDRGVGRRVRACRECARRRRAGLSRFGREAVDGPDLSFRPRLIALG
jgi:hypothetical protein